MNQRALLLGRDHVTPGEVSSTSGPGWSAAISKGHEASPSSKADPNEDACGLVQRGPLTLASVADAHWGGASAWIVAETAFEAPPRLRGPLSPHLLSAILKHASARIAAARTRSECAALIVAIEGRGLWWTGVGDCRCYRVTAEDVEVLNPQQSAYLGADVTWLPLTGGSADLSPGDRIVLATDGIPECTYGRETFTPPEVAALVRGCAIEDAAAALIREALDRGGEDNAAAVVIELQ